MNSHAPDPGDDACAYRAWIGREQVEEDVVAASTVRSMAATLDLPPDAVVGAGVLPPLWHWALFPPAVGTAELASDGHPERGAFLPPVSLPRRMWAGSALNWSTRNPLRIGEAAWRRSRIQAVDRKQGRTGELVFVRIEHHIDNARGPALSEVQTVVYRELSSVPGALSTAAGTDRTPQFQRCVTPNKLLLFRYSALTFNAHRIHYDQPYAVGEEGYPGLVVHGPLIASLLADLVPRHWPGRALQRFEFKALRPSFAGAPIALSAFDGEQPGDIGLEARDAQGLLAMQARASIA